MRAAALLLSLALAGCGPRRRAVPQTDLAPHRGTIVARAGDFAITDLDVAAVASARHLAPRAALDVLVDDALLATEAVRSGAASPEDVADVAWRARIQRLLEVDVEAANPPSAAPADRLESIFARRHAQLAHRGLRRVVHALWMTGDDAGVAALDAARAQMQAFRDALATSTGGHPTEEQFRAAAQRLGAGPEHRVEDLEPVDREGRTPSAGTYVPAFATAVWAMDPAQPLSQPFATSFGVHVALLLEEVPPMTRTDDEARDILRDEYAVAARVNAARELVTRLHQRSRVEISESTLREAERLARRGGP